MDHPKLLALTSDVVFRALFTRSPNSLIDLLNAALGFNPHILPRDVMIAPDFSRLRAPATESIAVALVEEARTRRREKDQRGRIQRSL